MTVGRIEGTESIEHKPAKSWPETAMHDLKMTAITMGMRTPCFENVRSKEARSRKSLIQFHVVTLIYE